MKLLSSERFFWPSLGFELRRGENTVPKLEELPEAVRRRMAQPLLPALLVVLPAIASQFGTVETKLDFAEAVVLALGALGTAIRGGASPT
jgi:hypothetical protein